MVGPEEQTQIGPVDFRHFIEGFFGPTLGTRSDACEVFGFDPEALSAEEHLDWDAAVTPPRSVGEHPCCSVIKVASSFEVLEHHGVIPLEPAAPVRRGDWS